MKYLELNQVLIEGEKQTLSLLAEVGVVTTLTGGPHPSLSKYLLAIIGFAKVLNGYICIDGEPLTPFSSEFFRRQMAYAPAELKSEGGIVSYEPPTVQDVFGLRANRDLPISNGILGEEIRKIGIDIDHQQAQLIAVAALLEKPVLLIDNPPAGAMPYLHQLAAKGRIVILASNDQQVLAASDRIEEI